MMQAAGHKHLLDLRIYSADLHCEIVESAYPDLHGTMTPKELFSIINDADLMYHVDREYTEANLGYQALLDQVDAQGEGIYYFRMNTDCGVEWVTAKVTPLEAGNDGLRILITSQENYDEDGKNLAEAEVREILFDGLGATCKNLIFIDVLHDKYKMLNCYDNELYRQLEVPARDGYVTDNEAYAINLVYEADQDNFREHTSLDWYFRNLDHKGAHDTFMVRHRFQEELRWVNVNTVCTRRDEDAFHVLYWVTESGGAFYDNGVTATLISEMIGQFRWERRTGHTPRLIVGDTYKSITGIGYEETPEETYQEYFKRIVPEDWERYHAYFQNLRDGVEGSPELVYRWIHPTKGLRYFRGRAVCLAATKDYTCYRGYHQDVTEIMQEKLAKDAELAHALKAAEEARYAKDDFFSKLSHDIRTPMNAVLGYTELLEKSGNDPKAFANYLAKLKDSGTVLYSLINNILEMAHLENGDVAVELSKCNIYQALSSVESILGSKMKEKNLHYTQQVNLDHPNVLCDITKLDEVFLNVLSNAIKFTPEGGHITLTVTEEPSSREGWGVYTTKFTDDGIGMSAEFLPHLFETFSRERTDEAHATHGTGLGGAVAKQLVDLMGGTITAESEPGHGTTVTLKMELEFAEPDERAPRAEGDAPFEGKRVLLAEDNDLNAEIATEILTDMGLQVERAENGEVCAQMMREAGPGYYDLVLMDIMMPQMDGYEATRAIRQLDSKRAHVPVVAMTANVLDSDRMRAFDAGMDDFLPKPIDVDQLEATLHKYLD